MHKKLTRFTYFVFAAMFILGMSAGASLVSLGCAEQCEQQAKRCFENQAQLCGTDGRWKTVINCSTLTTPYAPKGTWSCECPSGKCTCRRK